MTREAMRQERSKPILKEIHAWLLQEKGRVLPKSPIGEAIVQQCFVRWVSLTNFLFSDGTVSYHRQQRLRVRGCARGCAMGDEAIAAAVERFVKKISFSTQREVERIVRAALASGKIHGHETVTAAVTLSSEKLGLNTTIYSKIEL